MSEKLINIVVRILFTSEGVFKCGMKSEWAEVPCRK
jgi:hypothetical protein